MVVEPQSEEGVCSFEALEGAEPLDASFDFSVESFDVPVFSDATVDDVSSFVFFVVPSHDLVDGCGVLVEAVGDDGFWLCACNG